MPGDVAQLAVDIAAVYNVPHDGTSKRVSIAEGLAQAISAFVETLEVDAKAVIEPPQLCNAGGPHPEIAVTGSLK